MNPKKIAWFSIIFFLVSIKSRANSYVDSIRHYTQLMLNQPYPVKYKYGGRLQYFLHTYCSPKEVKQYTDEMHVLAEKFKDPKLHLDAELAFIVYDLHTHPESTDLALAKPFLSIINKAKKQDVLYIQLIAKRVLAEFVYWNKVKNYQLAFEIYMDLEKQLDKVSALEFPYKMQYLYLIGFAYYKFEDYNSATRLMHKSLRQPNANDQPVNKWTTLNTLGLIYQQKNLLNLAEQYFRDAQKIMVKDTTSLYYTISTGNIGYNQFLRGNWEEAAPLIETDYLNAVKHKDFGLAAGALIPLADIHIKQGKYDIAQRMLKEASNYIVTADQPERLEQLYKVYAKLYAVNNQYRLASLYLDSAISAKYANDKRQNSIVLLRAQQKHNLDIAEAAKKNYELKEGNRRLERNYLGILLLLVTGGSVVILYMQRQKFEYQRQQKEAQLAKAEAELQMANKNLTKLAQDISYKNTLIEKLERYGYTEKDSILEELQQSAILTDEDWISFRESFNKVYPGYIYRIKERYQAVTPSELRILTLAKLKYSNKEMASMLGVSPNAINVTWHRLRKKLPIAEDCRLEEFSESI